MKRLFAIILFVAACGPGAVSPSPSGQTLTGTFTLTNSEAVDRTATDCAGTGGYSDVRSGLDATVKNAAGLIIGKGSLVARMGDKDKLELFKCTYDFRITGIGDYQFYVVTVGRRGELTYSAEELSGMGWDVEMSLGS